MKKLGAFFIAAIMLFQSTAVFAADSGNGSNVEISFRLGDSTLKINGANVNVEKPFAENGTTLVPLRVITEAFGADVFWDGDTKQVTLNYQGVTIVVKIGDSNAFVNGQKQPLLLAPRIVNGSTMVPLRFITETFGADVKWNESNSTILVTFSGSESGPIDNISSALQKSDKAKIGDSYYKWSMDMPQNMILYDQSFDGRYLCFAADEDKVMIFINIYDNDENFNLSNIKVKEAQFAQESGTMISQETKATKSGTSYISTQFKDKYTFYERNLYIKNSNIFECSIFADIALTAGERQKYSDIAESFDFSFDKNQTEDTSNVVDGFRLFDDKNLNAEFRLPADWWDYSDEDKDNEFRFYNFDKNGDEIGSIAFCVYSIPSGRTAEEWANSDYTLNKQLLNPSMASFTQVAPITVAGKSGFYYTYTVKVSGVEYVTQDTFFYYEGYAYNISVKTRKNETNIKDKIINSLKVSKIDASKIGKLAMPVVETDEVVTTYENRYDKYKVSVPTSWYPSDNNSTFLDPRSAILISIESQKTTDHDFSKEAVSSTMEGMKDLGVTGISQKKSGKVKGEIVELGGTVKEDDITMHIQMNVFTRGDKTFVVVTMVPELGYSENAQNKIYNILNSIEVVK